MTYFDFLDFDLVFLLDGLALLLLLRLGDGLAFFPFFGELFFVVFYSNFILIFKFIDIYI